MKQKFCSDFGITLLVVPYWWNRYLESVAKTIHVTRPDITLPQELVKGDVISTVVPQQKEEKGII